MATQEKTTDFDIPDHVPADLVYKFDQTTYPGFDKDPYAAFIRIREEAPPIFFAPNEQPERQPGPGSWTIARAALGREALQNPSIFTTAIDYPGGFFMRPRRMLPLELDPPDHTKYRALLAPLFSPKSIDKMEADVLNVCAGLIDKVIDKGECMFMDDFARPYPATIFMKMMGLPLEEQDTFIEWEEMALNAPDAETALKGTHLMMDYLGTVIEQRYKEPKDDIVTLLTQSKVDGKLIDFDTVHDFCGLLFEAGLDTVTAAHTHIFYYLATHPERKQELLDDLDLIPNAIEELLRYHSWIGSPRTVTEDIEFHGVKMKAGDKISVSHALVDHDPAEFPEPETIDFNREPNPHMAFAAGPHRCAGSHLARRELRLSVREWLTRMPDFKLKDGYEPHYQVQGMFHPHDLHLVWTPPGK